MVKTLQQKREAKAAREAKAEGQRRWQRYSKAVASARVKAYNRFFPYVDLVRELDSHRVGSDGWLKVADRIKKELGR